MHGSEQALESFIWFKIIFICRIKIRIIKNTRLINSDQGIFRDVVRFTVLKEDEFPESLKYLI